MNVQVVEESCSSADSNIPCRRVIWRCSPSSVGAVLQLAAMRRKELLEKVRQKMNIHRDMRVVLRIQCETMPVEEINRGWENIVLMNMKKFLDLEKLLWNLSTFGGAFSSMGDYDRHFAEQAGAVSKHQLVIARELGNPVLEARCFLYMALSKAQLGEVEEALHSIRIIHHWAKTTGNDFLKNCAVGCYAKVKDISRFRDKYKCK